MIALIDTSFLVAMTNSKDRNHTRVVSIAQQIDDTLILPIPVLPEVCYLIGSRLGHQAMRSFLAELAASQTILEAITLTDLKRVSEILEIYADSELDFVDATIVTIAERLNAVRILSLDRRDFSIIRPKHCPYFEILP